MSLRIVSWLRRPKHRGENARPTSAVKSVRLTLGKAANLGLDVLAARPGAIEPCLGVDVRNRFLIVQSRQRLRNTIRLLVVEGLITRYGGRGTRDTTYHLKEPAPT